MGLYFLVPLTPPLAPPTHIHTHTFPSQQGPLPSRPLCTGIYGEQIPATRAPKKALEGLLSTSLF